MVTIQNTTSVVSFVTGFLPMFAELTIFKQHFLLKQCSEIGCRLEMEGLLCFILKCVFCFGFFLRTVYIFGHQTGSLDPDDTSRSEMPKVERLEQHKVKNSNILDAHVWEITFNSQELWDSFMS